MGEATSWRCPHCNHYATVLSANRKTMGGVFRTKQTYLWASVDVIICPNPKCDEFTLTAQLRTTKPEGYGGRGPAKLMQEWHLIPASRAVRFPAYVPDPIRQDYEEARLIQDLSPRAAATLARRCLQAMIRDVFKLAEGTLAAEIQAIRDRVSPQAWRAIDAVRRTAKFGAHPERDPMTIIDVKPAEVEALLRLLEFLIQDWYVAPHEREEHLRTVVEIADEKDQAARSGGAPEDGG